MELKIFPFQNESLGIQEKPRLILPSLKVGTADEKPNLNEMVSYLLYKDGIPSENIYRARELYHELTYKISHFGGLERIVSEHEVALFSKIIKKIEQIKDKGLPITKIITTEDAEILAKLVMRIETQEEEKEQKLKAATSLDQVLNTISDKIVNILLQEAMVRGSYINIAIALARLNPIVDVPDENDLRTYLKSKVLTGEFKKCLLDGLRGNKVNKSKLDSLQKKFFYFANSIVWIIAHMPEAAVKYLPRVGKVTRLSVNIIHQIPIFGPLINTFFGPVDEAIRVFELHPQEIRLLRKEAKQLELLKKISDAVVKLKDESVGLVRQVLP